MGAENAAVRVVSMVGLPDLPGWHVRLFADGTYDGARGRMATGLHTSPAQVRVAIERGAYLKRVQS